MNKNSFVIKIPLILIVLGALLASGIFLYRMFNPRSANEVSVVVTQTVKPNSPVFGKLDSWYKGNWTKPFPTQESSGMGNFKGQESTLNINSQNPGINHFEDENYLKSLGFTQNTDLSADGAGSSVWGYSKTQGDKNQIILFSYQTTPSSNNPNEPLQFNCPCQIKLFVFVSDPTSSSTQNPALLANPASQNCIAKGGALVIKKNGSGDEYGLCEFMDNMACEEWAFFRGSCPPGGVKTTGFDNIQQKYCAWIGGQTFAVENATCKLPSGKSCNDLDLFDGKCSQK